MKQYIVNAFAEGEQQGNPAAVCPLDQWLSDSRMQEIAARNNLSETAFLVREGEGYRIRWFTPRYEIDLCGHATLASAFVLHQTVEKQASELHFLSQSGPLTVTCQAQGYTLDFPSRPATPIPLLPELSQALGVEVRELYLSRDLMAVVDGEAAVRGLHPDFTRLAGLKLGDGVIVTAKGDACDFVSRCFYPKCGVDEDPVTGSAHCNLIPYWSGRLHKKELLAMQLSPQGGILYCTDFGPRVAIRGRAVLQAQQELPAESL